MVLPAAEQSRLQAILAGTLPDTCSIQRTTSTADGYGTTTDATTTVASVACRVTPRYGSGREGTLAGVDGAVITHVVTVPVGTDVRPQDVIQHAGARYEVQEVGQRSEALVLRLGVIERAG